VKLVSDADNNSPDYLARAEEIAGETRLSLRQAELYTLHVEEDHSIREAADRMGIAPGNASEKWHTVKQKIREAQEDRTGELQLP
jgi:DNA-directed RNA polymerase specialized sigma24 family protein